VLLLPAAVGGASSSKRIQALFNAQRARAGLAPVKYDAAIAHGCAKHLRYLRLNHTIGHGEKRGRPGYTRAGAKAGRIAVLSFNPQRWSAARSPWEGAPAHLGLMFTPRLVRAGGADNGNYHCLALTRYVEPTREGVYSWPSDGARGVPFRENTAYEIPDHPGAIVGLKGVIGPSLLVFSSGLLAGDGGQPSIRGVRLTGPGGAVKVRVVQYGSKRGSHKWVESETGVIMPVKPLKPGRRYRASLEWHSRDGRVAPQKFSFRTRGR
jgi:hypothetical protein